MPTLGFQCVWITMHQRHDLSYSHFPLYSYVCKHAILSSQMFCNYHMFPSNKKYFKGLCFWSEIFNCWNSQQSPLVFFRFYSSCWPCLADTMSSRLMLLQRSWTMPPTWYQHLSSWTKTTLASQCTTPCSRPGTSLIHQFLRGFGH